MVSDGITGVLSILGALLALEVWPSETVTQGSLLGSGCDKNVLVSTTKTPLLIFLSWILPDRDPEPRIRFSQEKLLRDEGSGSGKRVELDAGAASGLVPAPALVPQASSEWGCTPDFFLSWASCIIYGSFQALWHCHSGKGLQFLNETCFLKKEGFTQESGSRTADTSSNKNLGTHATPASYIVIAIVQKCGHTTERLLHPSFVHSANNNWLSTTCHELCRASPERGWTHDIYVQPTRPCTWCWNEVLLQGNTSSALKNPSWVDNTELGRGQLRMSYARGRI